MTTAVAFQATALWQYTNLCITQELIDAISVEEEEEGQ